MRHRSVARKSRYHQTLLGSNPVSAHLRIKTSRLLHLRSPDDFSDLGHKDIRCGDGFFVRVEFHVEGLDFFQVVGEDGGFLVDGFVPFPWEGPFPRLPFIYHQTLFLEGGGARADGILEDGNGFGVREALSMEKLQW